MNPTDEAAASRFNAKAAEAFALFTRPTGRAKVGAGDRALIERAEKGQLTLDGTDVATYRWGDGDRPVVLVHGWGSCAARLANLATALHESGHSVLAFDLPGHGESGGELTTIVECRDIIRELQGQYGSFSALVGYSFGSLCSFFALREGVKAEALVGIAGVSRFDHLVSGFRDTLGLSAELEVELRRRLENDLFPGEPDIWERFASPYAPEQIDLEQILLIHDEGDEIAEVHQSRETAEAYGDRAELVITQGLGHHRIVAAKETVSQVVAFLQGLGGLAAPTP
ncbi:alpha/beta hydrolase [Streptomyces violascens]|uniref:alpha/beta hydrolase n=1 Tax=Streptomyces violascens TaxID=67381 RepID=UPI0036C4BFEB